jgi:hypothetical protein
MKTGRNELCPCGSGKKYKKCCGFDQEDPDFAIPEEMLTGTPLDDYMMLFQGIALMGADLMEFDREGKALKKEARASEKRYLPGTDVGIPDSLYMSWLYLDFRFGASQRTVCERFMELLKFRKLPEPGPTLVRRLSESYATFYQVLSVSPDVIELEELGTGQIWRANREAALQLEGEAPDTGEIWYARLIPDQDGAYLLTSPFVFEAEAREALTRAVKTQFAVLKATTEREMPETALLRECCKASFDYWASYLMGEGSL